MFTTEVKNAEELFHTIEKYELPLFISNFINKEEFFTPISENDGLSEANLKYLHSYGFFFEGQIFCLGKQDIKSFEPHHQEVIHLVQQRISTIPPIVSETFVSHAKEFQSCKVVSVFSQEEIDFLTNNVWKILDPELKFIDEFKDNKKLTFGDKRYRPFLKFLSWDNNYTLHFQYRKFHLQKFFQWINEKKATQ